MENTTPTQDLAHLRPSISDEIDLGELLRNLFAQWRLIAAITVLGAVIGVATALLLPKEYRVEAVFDKPSTFDLAPLLAQPFVELDRQQILASFLRNLKSRDLIERVLDENNLLVDSTGKALSPEQRFSKIRNVSGQIAIAPAEFDFLPELQDATREIDQISLSLLTSVPAEAKLMLDALLVEASRKTTAEFVSDITGAKQVKLSLLNDQLKQLQGAAAAQQAEKVAQLEAALATAQALNITEPTTWQAWVHGTTSQPFIAAPQQPIANDTFLRGTRVLKAEIETAKNTLPPLENITIGFDEEGLPLTLSASSIRGQLEATRAININIGDVRYVDNSVKAQVPAEAEKPNRPLIAIAATVLAGFFGLFVALIRLAIRK